MLRKPRRTRSKRMQHNEYDKKRRKNYEMRCYKNIYYMCTVYTKHIIQVYQEYKKNALKMYLLIRERKFNQQEEEKHWTTKHKSQLLLETWLLLSITFRKNDFRLVNFKEKLLWVNIEEKRTRTRTRYTFRSIFWNITAKIKSSFHYVTLLWPIVV